MQVKDKNGDEKDGYDEGIIPCDWSTQCNVDIIIDDDLRKFLVEPLPKGANLTALFDCCHSGTILDMDQETNPQAIGETLSKVADGAVKIRSFYTAVQANVVCWSACTDAQKAYESRSGRSVMTEAFTKHVQSLKGSSLLAVGKAIYSEVERSAERLGHQDPQVSTYSQSVQEVI
ncbi:cytochrome c oxidase subunit 1 [Ceratobasidium sp. 394]|nr:cytochrome c oxidase subunit 1 [Ceratobasidium sp. 394]